MLTSADVSRRCCQPPNTLAVRPIAQVAPEFFEAVTSLVTNEGIDTVWRILKAQVPGRLLAAISDLRHRVVSARGVDDQVGHRFRIFRLANLCQRDGGIEGGIVLNSLADDFLH